MLDVLHNTPDTDDVPEIILRAHRELISESELTHAFADADPLALNLATAPYDGPHRGHVGSLLATA